MCAYPLTWYRNNTMRKYGVLLLHLQFGFWIAMTTCNLTDFYNVNAIKQVARVLIEKTHHTWNHICAIHAIML